MFKHFILTRFNVPPADNTLVQDKNQQKVLTPEWLDKRFELFENYYLPSLAGQTNRNFICLVYFDVKTGEPYRTRIAALAKQYNFIPKFVQHDAELGERLSPDILSYCDKDIKYVLTSRIDNDDAYHKQAVEVIQQHFVSQDRIGLNLTKGYRYLLGTENLLLKNSFINGPFFTFIEAVIPGKRLITALSLRHDTFFEEYPVRQITGKYYWLQTIHDSNLANDLSGRPSLDKNVLADFGLNPAKINLTKALFQKYTVKYFTNIKNFIPFRFKIFILKLLGKR